MNFRYTIHTVGGAWNGLVRHLHEKKADFGFAHFFHTLDRGKLIDFTVPFDTDNYCFLVSWREKMTCTRARTYAYVDQVHIK